MSLLQSNTDSATFVISSSEQPQFLWWRYLATPRSFFRIDSDDLVIFLSLMDGRGARLIGGCCWNSINLLDPQGSLNSCLRARRRRFCSTPGYEQVKTAWKCQKDLAKEVKPTKLMVSFLVKFVLTQLLKEDWESSATTVTSRNYCNRSCSFHLVAFDHYIFPASKTLDGIFSAFSVIARWVLSTS